MFRSKIWLFFLKNLSCEIKSCYSLYVYQIKLIIEVYIYSLFYLNRRKYWYVGTSLIHSGTRACLFLPDEGSWFVFPTRNNCSDLLHLLVLFYKVICNHTPKRQFSVLFRCIIASMHEISALHNLFAHENASQITPSMLF